VKIKKSISAYLDELNLATNHILQDRLRKIVILLFEAYRSKKQVFVFGNGGSGATASHFTCDLNKGTCLKTKKKFKVICLNDNMPSILAYANDVSYAGIFSAQLKNYLDPGDLVIGISVSGNSENVIQAIQYANRKKAKTVGLTGSRGGRLARIAKVTFTAPTKDMQQVEDIHFIALHVIMKAVDGLINCRSARY
jgi:D-sedoheptulose 7-phosphate isomerase